MRVSLFWERYGKEDRIRIRLCEMLSAVYTVPFVQEGYLLRPLMNA